MIVLASRLLDFEIKAQSNVRPTEAYQPASHPKSDDDEKCLPLETTTQLVDLEDNDNQNPINLPLKRKWLYVVLLAFMQAMM